MSRKSFLSRTKWWITHPKGFALRIGGEIYSRLHPEEPWISHHAVHFLEKSLDKSMKGLEWGSGRSTIWYANRISHLTSVEHDANWYKNILRAINEKNISNIDYKFINLNHPEDAPTFPYYKTTPDYVDVINKMPNESLDFVVVDGAYRQACVISVQSKLKAGGLLLLDNSNWMSFEEWHAPNWPIVHRSDGFFGETTIWRKP